MRVYRLGLFIAALFIFNACQDDTPKGIEPVPTTQQYDSKVVQEWQDLFLQIERNASGYRPGPAARALAYMGLAAYESCVPGMPDYQSIATRYAGLTIPTTLENTEYHWPSVVNAVYAHLFRQFFKHVQATDQFKIAALESSLTSRLSQGVDAEVLRRSRAHGDAVAAAVWQYSTTDTHGHERYLDPRPTGYTPPTGLGKWQPTAPSFARAVFPYWGKVRAFAIREEDKLARPPLTYSEDKNSAYYAQALEVYSRTTPQTREDQWIAEFWSDDVLGFTFSPASRWIAIANQVLALRESDLQTALFTAVKVGMALNDASVSAWHSKYVYNVERPVSYIQKFINPNWNISGLTSTGFMADTPSFPAYPSGHSTFGAAAAEVLTQIFGSEFSMTDRCHEGRSDFNGRPRSFNSFYEMAYENAYSRIWLGVHWRMDCDEGLRLGFLAGRRVNNLPFKR